VEQVQGIVAVHQPELDNYAFMQEPLLSGEVWVAFDMSARLADAFNKKPDDFVAFPAPAGPAGRGFMPVWPASPFRRPRGPGQGQGVVAYMLKPETQIATLKATNFFPRRRRQITDDMPASVKAFGPAIATMTGLLTHCRHCCRWDSATSAANSNQIYTDSFRAHRTRWGRRAWRAGGRGDGAQGDHRPGEGAMLGARQAIRRRLPGRLIFLPRGARKFCCTPGAQTASLDRHHLTAASKDTPCTARLCPICS